MKTLRVSVLTVSALVIANQTCAQHKKDFELHTQTMFDWYIATPEDRKATAFNIIAQVFMPKNNQELSKFARAADALVACINQETRGPDSEPVGKFVPICMVRIRARGFIE